MIETQGQDWPNTRGNIMSKSSSRSNRKYEIFALEARGGFTPAFRFPGKDERERVRDGSGAVLIVAGKNDAFAEAGFAMCEALNGRFRNRSPHAVDRLTGPEFAGILTDLGLTPNQFALFHGTRMDRVIDWIDGVQEIPHSVRTMLALLALPGAVQIAHQITTATLRDKPASREAAE
jgi:DNA-binding transcriptional regulator YiaG